MNPFAGIPMFLIRVLSVSISSHPLKLIIDIIIILDFIVIVIKGYYRHREIFPFSDLSI